MTNTLIVPMTVLGGYKAFFEKADDPNLQASKQKDGMFFVFRSIEAWKEEKCMDKDIPKNELILNEFSRNRYLAHP